jgi:hypothetical protein
MKIDWIGKLQHLLQTLAFCLAIATLQVMFQPERSYAPPLAHSLAIGFFTWAFIDLGRHLFASAAETGWPTGWAGLALVAGGIVAGYFLGNALADLGCRTFGWYDGTPPPDPAADLRNSVLITLLAGIVGSYYFYTLNKSAYLERKMAEARGLANESRLKLLESQLEPHMLFNTLANLRALVSLDPPRAQAMLDHLIAFLRSSLDASQASRHPLSREFERLHDYLALMGVRMGPRLSTALDLPPELAQVQVPPLLLQPLVENAIKHGLEPKVEGGSIEVRARRVDGMVEVVVRDSGLGMAATQGTSGSAGGGLGLALVRERLASAWGPAASLVLQGDAQGTVVTLRFPHGAPA